MFKCSQIQAQFIVASDPNKTNFVDFIRLIRKYRPDYIISMTSGHVIVLNLKILKVNPFFNSKDLYFAENGSAEVDVGSQKLKNLDCPIPGKE